VGARFKSNFNLSAAAGRDVLLGEKDSGAASTRLNFIDLEGAIADVLKFERIFQFHVLLLLPEVMSKSIELDLGFTIAVQNHGHQKQ
jgi:hypothetical protein